CGVAAAGTAVATGLWPVKSSDKFDSRTAHRTVATTLNEGVNVHLLGVPDTDFDFCAADHFDHACTPVAIGLWPINECPELDRRTAHRDVATTQLRQALIKGGRIEPWLQGAWDKLCFKDGYRANQRRRLATRFSAPPATISS